MIGEIAGALIAGNKIAGGVRQIGKNIKKMNKNIQKYYTPKTTKAKKPTGPKVKPVNKPADKPVPVINLPESPLSKAVKAPPKVTKAQVNKVAQPKPKLPGGAPYSPAFLQGMKKGFNL